MPEKQLIFVEIDRMTRVPFSACTRDQDGVSRFDLEYCKRDNDIYAEWSGNGLYLEHWDNLWWAIEGVLPVAHDEDTGLPMLAPSENRLASLPQEYQRPFEEWAIFDEDVIYCDTCDDFMPADSHCEHIWWDEDSGEWSTPGYRIQPLDMLIDELQAQ